MKAADKLKINVSGKPSVCLIAAGLLVAVFLCFGQVRTFGFVDYDDRDYVVANPHLGAGTVVERVTWAFTAFHAANWHPVTWLSFIADHALFDLDPAWYHTENLVFHGLNAVLLLALLVRLTGSVGKSALVAALFALHPLRAESVAWVTERKGLLMAFFCLLTLLAYVSHARRPSRGGMLAVTVLFAVAVLSKPQAVVLPLVLLLCDWWPLGRVRPESSPAAWRSSLLEKLPLLLLSAAVIPLVVAAQRRGGAVAPFDALAIGPRLACAVVAPIAYLGKTIRPFGLSPAYPFTQPAAWQVVGATLILGTLTIGAVRRRATHPWFVTGWLGFLALLAPVSSLFQVGGQALADRYTYLPHIPLFMAAVWSGANALHHRPAPQRATAAVVALLLLPILGFIAHRQTTVWLEDALQPGEHV